MFVFGITSTLLSSILYSLRASYFRDFGSLRINKASITFYFRLLSLPVILLAMYIFHQSPYVLEAKFYLWLSLATVINLFSSFYQLRLFQKHQLSTIESQKFVGVFFALIAGYYLFSEVLAGKEILGIFVLIASFLVLFFFESNRRLNYEVLFYYFLLTIIDIVNRQAIRSSTPIVFSLYITLTLVISNLLLAKIKYKNLYSPTNTVINYKLIITGIISGFAIIGTSYGYQYLPVGLVVSILSTQTFFSLGLSHLKHNEVNLMPKVISSSLAFLGIAMIMFK